MAAYDDSYEIADLVRANPCATYNEIMDCLRAKREAAAEEWRRKRAEE